MKILSISTIGKVSLLLGALVSVPAFSEKVVALKVAAPKVAATEQDTSGDCQKNIDSISEKINSVTEENRVLEKQIEAQKICNTKTGELNQELDNLQKQKDDLQNQLKALRTDLRPIEAKSIEIEMQPREMQFIEPMQTIRKK